jgi:hypothetical protein
MSDSSPTYYFSPEALAPNGTQTLMPTNSQDPPRTNFTLSPESALQYYRGSSVVLGTPEYVNYYGQGSNTNLEYWGTTSYNITTLFPNYFNRTGGDANERRQNELSFLDCLNRTIAAAVPIIDPGLTVARTSNSNSNSNHFKQLTSAQKAGIILGGTFALFILAICCLPGFWKTIGKSAIRRGAQRRVPLGRHTGGRRVVFLHGEILPAYLRGRDGAHTAPNPTSRFVSEQQPLSHAPLLPSTGRSSPDGAMDDQELPPPYSPQTVSHQ